MLLHNENVTLGDAVYDVSLQRGWGIVTEVRLTGSFDVRFRAGFTASYGANGTQTGETQATLYWYDPASFIIPLKGESMSSIQRTHINSFRASLIEAKNSN